VQFEQLYARELAPMTRMAYLTTRSRPVAEEVVHEAFATVLQRWASIDAPGGYLRTVVVRGAVAARQDGWREVETSTRLAGIAVTASPHEPGTEDMARALGVLPPRQRAALVLRFYADLTLEDVGTALGCPAVTARSLVHRGLATLKEEIER
jgi:RNA polymerase sigma factor (sigma-70 family)